MNRLLICGLLLGLAAVSASEARAENSACWGDDSRGDISCTKITEKLLLSFRGQSASFIQKAMNAPGRTVDNGLHFLSNYGRGQKTGSGDVNVTFEGDRTAIVNAAVDTAGKDGNLMFIWNAYAAPALGNEFDPSTKDFARAPYCSDFSAKPRGCKGDDTMDDQLTLLRMQTGANKATMRDALEMSCNPGQGLTVSDSNGDCDRLRALLRK